MLRNTLAVLAVLGLAATSQAGFVITTSSQPTTGLAGFNTWTVTATSDNGGITAVDFVGSGANSGATAKGFFGAMNQVNPFGLPSIFQDNNGVMIPAGANVSQDSQFSVLSSAVVVPPGLAEEGPAILQAAWAWSSPQALSLPIAQIVIPIAATGTVNYRGTMTALVQGVQTDFDVNGTIGGPVIPEPATLSLVGLAMAALVGFRARKRS
jgi:PEP-CTERM motif